MSERPQDYIARMLKLVEDQDPERVLAGTARRIKGLIVEMSDAELRKRPAPRRWSVAEILAHLADSEVVTGWRVRHILGSPGTSIQAFDQDAWAATGHYSERDASRSLAQFQALRDVNLELLTYLTPEQRQHYGRHAERGRETIEHIVRMLAGHDVNHTRQIESISRPTAESNS
jgi:uncharacterized damage-inducible protein DinB